MSDPRLVLPTRLGVSRRDALRGFVAAAALAAVPGTAWAATDVRPGAARTPRLDAFDRRVLGRVDATRALQHIWVLSEQIGPRISGTPSEHVAADYLAGVLDGLGYDVALEPFGVPDRYLAELSSPDADLGDDVSWQAGASPQGALDTTVSAPLVDAGSGLAAEAYPADTAGKVVLLDYLTSAAQRRQQVTTAVAQGAVAVVLARVGTDPLRRLGPVASVSVGAPVPVPVVGAGQVHGERLRAALAAGPVTLAVGTTHHAGLTSYNVVGDRAVRADAPVVMVTAHYDSVVGAPGANDDASGTALCLELARVFASLPTRATLRFALWGSEEFGLIGSRDHAGRLTEAEAQGISGVFQNDMVATSWEPADDYWLLAVDGQPNTTTTAVKEAGERLGYAAQIIGPVVRGSSDHVPFHERGIPAANFSWREVGDPPILEPIYHTPEDTIAANISLERLQVSLELIGNAAYHVANGR